MITLGEGAEDTVDSSSDMTREEERRRKYRSRERDDGESEQRVDKEGGVVSDLTLDDRRCKRSTHGPTRPVRVMGCMTDG